MNVLYWTGYACLTLALVVGTRANSPRTVVRALILLGIFCWAAVIMVRMGRA